MSSEEMHAVAFGTNYLANPDLQARVKAKAALNEPDQATFYSPCAKGAMPITPGMQTA